MRQRSSSVIEFTLCFERTIFVAAGASPEKYVLTDDDFPPGVAIADIELLVETVSLQNLTYNLYIYGSVRPDAVVVSTTAIGPITASGYQQTVVASRSAMAARAQVVLEVAPTIGGSGSAVFTIVAAVRIWT